MSDTNSCIDVNKITAGFNTNYIDSNDLCDSDKELLHICDSIFEVNENSVDDLLKRIVQYNKNYTIINNCLDYALCNRTDDIIPIFFIIKCIAEAGNYNPSKNLSRSMRILLIDEKIINEDLSLYELEYRESCQENEIMEIIREDKNVEFVDISCEDTFDTNEQICIEYDNPIFKVESQKNEDQGFVTYAQYMAFSGAAKCIRYVLMNGDFDKSNIFKYAIAGGNSEIIKLLTGPNYPNSFDDCFGTSIKFHRDSVSEWLLKSYKCENVELKEAIECYNNRAFFFLLKNRINITQNTIDEALSVSIDACNIVTTKYLLEKCNANLNQRNYRGLSLIDCACNNGDLETVKYLVEKYHVDLNEAIPRQFFLRNCTPLIFAVYSKNLKLVKYLIEECNANTDVYNNNGENLLECAAYSFEDEKGNFEIVKYLIEERHMKVIYQRHDLYNLDKVTLLHKAAKNYDMNLLKYLIEKVGLNPLIPDGNGKTPLHYACENSCLGVAKYLVNEYHADINKPDFFGMTPLEYASSSIDSEIFDYFTEKK